MYHPAAEYGGGNHGEVFQEKPVIVDAKIV
jgi:hypothetical protein